MFLMVRLAKRAEVGSRDVTRDGLSAVHAKSSSLTVNTGNLSLPSESFNATLMPLVDIMSLSGVRILAMNQH